MIELLSAADGDDAALMANITELANEVYAVAEQRPVDRRRHAHDGGRGGDD